ncbi:FliC/FljB family flagellin [Kushneria konosiri]|uniref:Flagellin n=2 Tax=Kushneria TaxID=504090 RepID=A0A2Z2H9E2_9GAMM|nr:FliC/FljB family flagellin [Kushneria konosiri]ARS54055.1 hypothetical protein B9G99_15185 [Kushneria konosiri]
MAMVINTNALSLNAQNNLNKSQQSLNTAIERLSSGSRINSAKDDAAGLAISNRMNAQVTGLNQANRNANDGISVAQTAEGALSQVTDNLQRIRELTVQSQNEVLSDSDRGSLQKEIGQRLEEIQRISEQTQFNGKNLLDGSNNTMKIQVGANDGQTIDLNMVSVSTGATGLNVDKFNVDGFAATPTAPTTVKAGNGSDITIGTTASTTEADPSFAKKDTNETTVDLTGATLVKDGDNYYAQVGTGPTAKFYAADVKATEGNGVASDPNENASISVTVDTNREITQITADPLATIDKALASIDDARSTLGAQQNRLQSTIEGNSTTSTNLSAAMSQIKDADYATEVSNMSKAQILQQAGTSVLAQANQTTQGVMSLLR